jgi:hypothetical protein
MRRPRRCWDDALAAPEGSETDVLPAAFWMVRPHPPRGDGEERLLLRGAVLVRVRGRLARRPSSDTAASVKAAASTDAVGIHRHHPDLCIGRGS